MSYTRNHARHVLTDAASGLFTARLADQMVEIDAGLRWAVGPAGKLRNKAHATRQQQGVKVRVPTGARGAALTANEGTAKKEIALSEALKRSETPLGQIQATARQGRAKGPLSRQTVAYLRLAGGQR